MVDGEQQPQEKEEDVDIAERRETEIKRLLAFGFSEADIKKMDDFDASDFIKNDERLPIKFNNLSAFRFLVKQPLIWRHSNDSDGVRLLDGLDYTRVFQILDMTIKQSVFTAEIKRAMFARLQQIEIGAKASFDERLAKYREDNKPKK